jgi:Domain of unknown function (DUF4124)
MIDQRLLSLLLAILTLLGAGFAIRFVLSIDKPAPAQIERAPQIQQAPPTPTSEARPEAVPVPISPTPGGLHKCIGANGQVSYTDQACKDKEVARAVAPLPDSAGLRPQRSYQEQLAERPSYPTETGTARRGGAIAQPGPSSRDECQSLDLAIAQIDANLRRLHGPQEGDFWTERRRQATQRKYDLHCGGY